MNALPSIVAVRPALAGYCDFYGWQVEKKIQWLRARWRVEKKVLRKLRALHSHLGSLRRALEFSLSRTYGSPEDAWSTAQINYDFLKALLIALLSVETLQTHNA